MLEEVEFVHFPIWKGYMSSDSLCSGQPVLLLDILKEYKKIRDLFSLSTVLGF